VRVSEGWERVHRPRLIADSVGTHPECSVRRPEEE
jgi:hypothetical protein